MYSKVKIMGHPVHAMIVGFPVAFYTGTLITTIIYAARHDVFWYHVAMVCNVAAVATASLAAVPGFIDWLNIPSAKGAKKTGLYHLTANVTALVLFIINLIVQYNHMDEARPDATISIVLSAVGFGLTMIAGFLGWALVQNHHVGISLTPAQEDLEPLNGVKS